MVMLSLLKIVIIGKFFTRHDPSCASKQSHAGFAINGPFDHLAVRFARMIYEASNCPASGIDDHLVVETHQVITLLCVRGFS
jgi:hypothetical protein